MNRRQVLAALLAAPVGAGLAGCAMVREKAGVGPPPILRRQFGVAGDPWAERSWAAAVGSAPTMVMEFTGWASGKELDTHFAQARTGGLQTFMITWEPWKTVPASAGSVAQYAVQPDFANAAIAAGHQDGYIIRFAQSAAAAGMPVYIRYAHEMNGDWYPWSRDPQAYVAAWKHVVDVFRANGADNVKFVFSPNGSLYQTEAEWLPSVQQYWPGPEYVDFVGITMINFGGEKERPVADFAVRLDLLHRTFGKEAVLPEVNTASAGRVNWLADLRTWLDTDATWVRAVVLSQGSSRAGAQLGDKVGDLTWQVAEDPQTQPVVRGMIDDFAHAGTAG